MRTATAVGQQTSPLASSRTTRSEGRAAAIGLGENLAASGVGVATGVVLGEAIVGEGAGALGDAAVGGSEGGVLGEGEGGLADCRQDAKRSAPKPEMTVKERRWLTVRV